MYRHLAHYGTVKKNLLPRKGLVRVNIYYTLVRKLWISEMRAASSSDGYSQLPHSFWAAGHLKDETRIAWLIARVICFNKMLSEKETNWAGNHVLYCCFAVLEIPITRTRTCSKSTLCNKCSQNWLAQFHLSVSKTWFTLKKLVAGRKYVYSRC